MNMNVSFWIGAILTALGSWLLAIALLSRLIIERPLTQYESMFAFASGVAFAIVIVVALRRRIGRHK